MSRLFCCRSKVLFENGSVYRCSSSRAGAFLPKARQQFTALMPQTSYPGFFDALEPCFNAEQLFQSFRLAVVSGDPVFLIQTLNVFVGVSSCHLAALIRPSRQLG